MSVLDKLKKNTTIKASSVLTESKVFAKKDEAPTGVPLINVALSGRLKGGLSRGLLQIAGPSKHFKTGFTLLLAKAFLKRYPDGAILFYDSEFGSPASYFASFGLDPERVFHSPITDIEQLKHDIMQQLAQLTETDNILIMVDSIGNLASKKEVEDALEGKSAADMTRAKQLKSLFRMVTPHLTLKNIPMVAINHTYKTMEMYAKDVVGGGTGGYYSADNIWIVGRQQDKDSKKELVGWNFVINIEKSRYVKEKSKIIVNVRNDGGIDPFSGLFELAKEGGYIVDAGKRNKYARVNRETGEVGTELYGDKDFESSDFWLDLMKTTDFPQYIEDYYALPSGSIIDDEEVDKFNELPDTKLLPAAQA